MRILTFLHSFEPGGVERVALRLNRAWLAAGIDAVVVMGRGDGAMAGDATDIPYHRLSSGRIPTAFWETIWMIVSLPRFVRRAKPDVLFCAGNTYSIVAVAMKLILGKRCPPIVAKISNDLIRNDMPTPVRWGYRKWCRFQSRFIDHFIGMAAPMRAEMADILAVADSRISIICDPAISARSIVAHARLSATGPGRRYVGAGRLSQQKNFALLVDAFAKIAKPSDQLTIYGEGSERPALERRIRRLGLERQVAMPGFVESIVPALQSADVFVLSSDYEGVPAVIVEALAAGIAIVATDCSVSMRDMLDGGALGTLVPPGDCDALAAAMANIATGSQQVAARQEKAGHFTIEHAASAYVDVLRAVAGKV